MLAIAAVLLAVAATIAQADPPATKTCKGCVDLGHGRLVYMEFECPGAQECCWYLNENNDPMPSCEGNGESSGASPLYMCPVIVE